MGYTYWEGGVSCGSGKCWCPDVHGTKGHLFQHRVPETNGCSMPIWPGNDHCCDEHDKCYCKAGKTKRECEDHFCGCLSWYNKGWCGGEIFTLNYYYSAQRDYVRCIYYPTPDKWHLIDRRRIESDPDHRRIEVDPAQPEPSFVDASESDGPVAGTFVDPAAAKAALAHAKAMAKADMAKAESEGLKLIGRLFGLGESAGGPAGSATEDLDIAIVHELTSKDYEADSSEPLEVPHEEGPTTPEGVLKALVEIASADGTADAGSAATGGSASVSG